MAYWNTAYTCADLTQLRYEVNPLLKPCLTDEGDKDKQLHPTSAVVKMLQMAEESRFPAKASEELETLIYYSFD